MSHDPLGRLAQRVRAWAEAAPTIRALFWYGGYGYGQLLPGSDLDVAVLLHPWADISQVAEGLMADLRAQEEPMVYWIIDPVERRLSVWMGEVMTKLDVVFGRTVGELAWLADASDVPSPRLTAAWPVHEPDVTELLQRASRPILESDVQLRRERCEKEIDKFLIAFEACSAAHAKGDAYAFYFQYNLALGRHARLVQLVRVGHRHLYLPRNLLTGPLSEDERESYCSLAGTLQLSEGHERKRSLARAFLHASEEARTKLGIRRHPVELGVFLERIQRRDSVPDERSP
jgi:hypothetical protein